MTAILGFVTDTEMLLMGDGAYHAGCRRVLDPQPKVFTFGHALIGSAGGVRHGQIVRYHSHAFERDGTEADPLGTLVGWVEDLRRTFKNHGFLGHEKEHGTEKLGEDEELLVAYAGLLWTVGTNWQVIRHGRGPTAIGCGTQAARAAMLALIKCVGPMMGVVPRGYDHPAHIMERAMEATAAVDVDVAPPFTLIRRALP